MVSLPARISVVLLALIVSGGMLIGLTGGTASSSPSFSGANHDTSLISAGGVAPGFTFGGAAAPFSGALNSLQNSLGTSYAPIAGAGATTTTVTMTASTTTAVAPRSLSTTVIQSNPQGATQQPGQATQSRNSSGFIEFVTNLSLQVPDTSAAVDRATAIAYSFGGYVAYSTQGNTSASAVLRIPASNYQSALAQVKSLGALLSGSASSNDVTVKYTDLNATLQSLIGEQASLLKLLNQSVNINATLEIESRLQAVNAQINDVQSQMLQTKVLIDYATISIDFEERARVLPLSLRLTGTPKSGMSPLSVTFNAVVNGGSAPYIVNYNFGDGSSAQGQALIHTFDRPGPYNVTVTATDHSANVTLAWTLVNVAAPPAASSLASFTASVTDLFLRVVGGILEVAVVIVPIALALLVAVFPFRRRLRLGQGKRDGEGASGGSSSSS